KCGIEDLHFHDLRHSAIGILFELGLQIHQVAVISGHSDWKMLKRYTHIDAEDVHAALEKREARRRNRQALMEYLNISSN
ncbi:TPA: tyrosine-type recombinase/integrase, partial [Pseudomonas aeruginosa]|nr:tyrosine-type recombinase/integrase [Pseudomonas aeruginosa]